MRYKNCLFFYGSSKDRLQIELPSWITTWACMSLCKEMSFHAKKADVKLKKGKIVFGQAKQVSVTGKKFAIFLLSPVLLEHL